MHDAYKRSHGDPFYVDIPENRYCVVSSAAQMKEIDAAPQSTLSLLGAAKDLLQPHYTMKGFDWMVDKQGSERQTLIKPLRTDLTRHLPEMPPDIRLTMSLFLDMQYTSLRDTNGLATTPIFPLVSKAIPQSNAFTFFEEELSRNPEFIDAGIAMVEHTLIISDVMRLLPRIVSDSAGKFLASRLNSGNIVYNNLEPLVSRRFEERDRAKQGQKVPVHRKDCVQWIMDNSPKTKPWTIERVVHEIVALWYGSIHITSVSACFALFDLCNHPEYIDPLRKESGGNAFPLMDSFIKESTRLSPTECMSIRRKALKPFHFADGTKVETGQWFHGFRYIQPDVLGKSLNERFQVPEGQEPSRFTDVSGVPFWGAGKITCGGRFYTSAAMKIVLGLFIQKWDMQLTEPGIKQKLVWRSWIYPNAKARAVLRPVEG
ncbi:putative cytochrome P450 [Xylariaceae sp. FL0804]|nr:putative cytochrome P450 [Xylariaceae sp. FL0804]